METQIGQHIKELMQILLGKNKQGGLRAQMVRGASGTFVLKVVNTALALAISLILARILGAQEYGVYAYAISWASLLSIPTVLGLSTLLIREVARYKALGDWRTLKGILLWSDRVVLLASIGLTSVVTLSIWGFRGYFDLNVRTALWIAMALVPLLSFLFLRQGALQGLGYVVEAQVPQLLILPGGFLVLTLGFYFTLGLSGPSVVGLRVLAGLIAVLIAFFLLRKHSPEPILDVSPVYRQREWFKSTFPLVFVRAAGMINPLISTVMVGTMLGTKAAGIFDVAMKGATLVSFVLMGINAPLAPAIAELYALEEKERLQRLVTKSVRVAFLFSLPVAIGLILFGRWVLLIFGKEFIAGSITIAILSAGQLMNVGIGSVEFLLNMTGHEWDTAKGAGIAVFTNVVFNVILIHLWGVKGAATAFIISLIIWKTILAIYVHKKLGICPTALGRQIQGTG